MIGTNSKEIIGHIQDIKTELSKLKKDEWNAEQNK